MLGIPHWTSHHWVVTSGDGFWPRTKFDGWWLLPALFTIRWQWYFFCDSLMSLFAFEHANLYSLLCASYLVLFQWHSRTRRWCLAAIASGVSHLALPLPPGLVAVRRGASSSRMSPTTCSLSSRYLLVWRVGDWWEQSRVSETLPEDVDARCLMSRYLYEVEGILTRRQDKWQAMKAWSDRWWWHHDANIRDDRWGTTGHK